MRVLPLILVVLFPWPAIAEEPIFAEAKERETWEWLKERAGRTEHVERDRQGKLKWVGFRNEEEQKGDYYSGSLELEDGRVVQMVFNKAHFTNEDLRRIATFHHLKKLVAWHNWDREDSRNEETCSGAGLVHLKPTAIESINFGGSRFNDVGMRASLELPQLRELIVYHTFVTDAGVAAIADHPGLTTVVLGPQHSQRVTQAALEPLSKIPNLKHLELNETLLAWDGGLEHLAGLKGQLETFTCKEGYIPEGDLEKLKAALPETKIEYTPADEQQLARMQRAEARRKQSP